MALIDIVKLNAEIDKMIATQEWEIQNINNMVEVKERENFQCFIKAMEKYSETAEQISDGLLVYVGCYNDGYGNMRSYDLQFYKRRHVLHVFKNTTIGDRYRECCVYYDAKEYIPRIVNEIAAWYAKNPDEFEKRFEDACIRVIKQKAEKANAKYQTALDKQKEMQT